jgi:hypothetical protein
MPTRNPAKRKKTIPKKSYQKKNNSDVFSLFSTFLGWHIRIPCHIQKYMTKTCKNSQTKIKKKNKVRDIPTSLRVSEKITDFQDGSNGFR